MTGVACGLACAPAAFASTKVVADWRLDDGSGQTARDSSGNGNHGTLGATSSADAGDPSWISWTPGLLPFPRRNALRFSGEDYVTVRDDPSLEPTKLSVSAVVRASKSPGPYRYVVSKGALECRAASYGLYTGKNGGLIFYISDGVHDAMSPDAGAALWDGAWHTVVGSFDGTKVRLSVDDREVGSGTTTNVSLTFGRATTDNLYIGDYHGTCADPTGFVGDVNSVSITNRNA